METITIPEGYQLVKVSESEYKIVPKEKVLPKTWEEFCRLYLTNGNDCYINANSDIVPIYKNIHIANRDKNTLPSKEKAEAILALCQLIMLRDYYNDGWKRRANYINFTITKSQLGEWFCLTPATTLFTFKTKELAKQFLENFKDLFEKLNPLYE